MWDNELREICAKLKPILGAKADTLWFAYLTAETPQAAREAATLIQLFGMKFLSARVDSTSILLPPPSKEAARGEFYLGQLQYNGKPAGNLFLTRQNFQRHITITATTGAGKTNVAQILLLGLLDAGIPFLVIDWKRAYRDLLTLNHPKVKHIQVYSVGRKSERMFNWNPLRAPPGEDKRNWNKIVAESTEESHLTGPGMADVFLEVFDLLFERFGAFENDNPERLPNFFDAWDELQKMSPKGRRGLWYETCVRFVRDMTYGEAKGAFNARHPIKIEELLTRPVILELDQSVSAKGRVFFNEVMLRWIHLHRLHQGETSALRHVLLLEEVHNLFVKRPQKTIEALQSVYREIRSFGQGLIGITQNCSELPVYLLGNTNTQIYLAQQHEDDIVAAKRALFLKPGEEVYLDRLPVGEGIVKIRDRCEPCHVKFPLVPIKKRGDSH